MRAVTIHGVRKVELSDVPMPQIEGPDEVVVKVEVAGLCGSDMHPYCGREKGIDDGTIMGHEFVGRVHEVGTGVHSFKPGERVVAPFTPSCGQCWFCTHRLTCRCSNALGGVRFGWVQNGKGLQGAQAEYIRVPLAETTLLTIPDTVTNEQALLCGDVLATGWFCADSGRVRELAREGPVTVVVVGCGPVGLMALVASRALGATTVFAVDAVPERLELAEEFGGRPILAGSGDPVALVRSATEGRGADVVLEAVGSQGAIRLAFDLIRPGGVISSVGVHTEGAFSFTPAEGYSKNVTYSNGRSPARIYMEELLNFVEAGSVDVARIITHRVSLSDTKTVADAYNMFELRKDGCVKMVMVP